MGDLGKHWGEVYSNTTVKLFLRFLNDIHGFSFQQRPSPFPIESLPKDGYCQLKSVTQPLQWITDHLCQTIHTAQGHASNIQTHNGAWQIKVNNAYIHSEKIILATGADPKSLSYPNTTEIPLHVALTPSTLSQQVSHDDCVAVFGSSHSSMIIMKNLLDAGVNNVVNFYLMPHRYAVNMGEWTLYDNTGLKGATAAWVRQNISQRLDQRITRHISNDTNIEQHLPACNKAIYPVGFEARTPTVAGMAKPIHDKNTGIIAPGLFGVGIAFPREVTNPFGGKELNVGLYKFMNDIKQALPLWTKYDL